MSRGDAGTKGKRPAPTTFGARLRAVRRSFGWSQKVLSSLLGVAQQSVSNWEKDLVPPIGAAQAHLASVLGIDWKALETGKGFRVSDGTPLMTLAEEGTLATEESSKKPLLLPKAAKGEGWLVEAGSGESSPLDPKAVLKEIESALKKGGSVWVVVKRSKPKPRAKKKV